jgi:hypothetical protein
VKGALKGTHFQSVDQMKSKTMDLLNSVLTDDLQHYFEQWKICLQPYIDRWGEYIKRDRTQFVIYWKNTQFFTPVPFINSHVL